MPIDLDAFRKALAEGRTAFEAASAEQEGRPATRTGGHVAPIHRYIARELVRHGLPEEWIAPDPSRDDGRYWTQSVRKTMERLQRSRILRTPGVQKFITRVGEDARQARRKPLGAYHPKEVDVSAALDESGPLVVVSVKAPMSSVAKNAVNRYEEGIGEATNLHTRFPMLVFGFLMILPQVRELYVRGQGPTQAFHHMESLILATSNRRSITDPPGSYEAAALVLVDHERQPYPAIATDAPAPGSPLRIEQFFDTLMELHWARNRGLERR